MTPLRSLASASRPMILLIPSPISLSPLSCTMSAKPPPAGTSMSASGAARIFVGNVLHEQQGQDVVLVLRRVHAAAQLVAALPERGVKLGFLQCHSSVLTSAPEDSLESHRIGQPPTAGGLIDPPVISLPAYVNEWGLYTILPMAGNGQITPFRTTAHCQASSNATT